MGYDASVLQMKDGEHASLSGWYGGAGAWLLGGEEKSPERLLTGDNLTEGVE